ncbi:MAG: hypothetical protein CYPHOPRED_002673, partial [Cyphobasidiales sp. Tagirdzhanova-0007]
MKNGTHRTQILICGNLVWADYRALYPDFEFLVVQPDTSREAFLADCREGGRFSAVEGIYRHNTSTDWIGLFDSELVAALPKGLSVIGHNDQIDIAACTKRGIIVANTPGAVDDATATTAMFLLLSCFRQYWPAQSNVRQGKFKQGLKPAHDPEGKVLGIIGMGGSERPLSKRIEEDSSKGSFCTQLVPEKTLKGLLGPVTYRSELSDLLKEADVIALCLPLNASTRGFFDSDKFAQMKSGAILVNTARGGVVDEDAMIAALEENKISAIGLDVYPDEPNINPQLVKNSKATLLPHVGTETEESQEKMEVRALDNLKTYFAT